MGLSPEVLGRSLPADISGKGIDFFIRFGFGYNWHGNFLRLS